MVRLWKAGRRSGLSGMVSRLGTEELCLPGLALSVALCPSSVPHLPGSQVDKPFQTYPCLGNSTTSFPASHFLDPLGSVTMEGRGVSRGLYSRTMNRGWGPWLKEGHRLSPSTGVLQKLPVPNTYLPSLKTSATSSRLKEVVSGQSKNNSCQV